MTLNIPDDLATEIQTVAQERGQTPEMLLRQVWMAYRDSVTPPSTPAEVRQRMYRRARAYWQAQGMADRLQLSDAQLDEQFDFIDADGVPYLKSDGVPVPESPLESLLGILDTDVTDLSTSTRRALYQHVQDDNDRVD